MKKNIGFFLAAITAALIPISCTNEDILEPHEISEIYGYTYSGGITASGGNTLKPSLIIYNDERVDWNMGVNGMSTIPFYYNAVKNSQNNYTMYWFSAINRSLAKQKINEKADMTVHLGINTLNEVVILLTQDNLTGKSAMQNVRVPMQMQAGIEKKTTPPEPKIDETIEDITIGIPSGKKRAPWGGQGSYTGTFEYLIGNGGMVERGNGTCDGGLTPEIVITDTGANTAKIRVYSFAYSEKIIFGEFEISGVETYKDGNVYYLHRTAQDVSVPEKNKGTAILEGLTVHGKLENNQLKLRLSFTPDVYSVPFVEIFTSK